MLSTLHLLQVASVALAADADPLLEWVKALAPATLAGFLFWALFARLTKQVADLQADLSEIKNDISRMAIKNAEDHGYVRSEIAKLEERIDNLRSPWELRRAHKND